jgi:hypothetical protein
MFGCSVNLSNKSGYRRFRLTTGHLKDLGATLLAFTTYSDHRIGSASCDNGEPQNPFREVPKARGEEACASRLGKL